MKNPLKNLLISIGPGYSPGVRLLHNMAKDKSDSKILLFNLEKQSPINEDLREDYSIKYSEFKKAFDLLEDWLSGNQFDLVGISFMSHHWNVFTEISRIVRRVLPDCKIITGGVHAWHMDPLGTLEHCDYVCAAEGEEVYSALIDMLSLSKNNHPLRIPGLIERNGQEIIRTPVKEYMPIDNIPVPAMGSKQIYYLYSLEGNTVFINEDPLNNHQSAYVHIGRGCPFKCTFCINSLIEKHNVRIRSVEKVIEEIKVLLEGNKGFKSIMFMDEIFPLKDDWLKEFALKYRKNIGLPFVITLYPGMLTYEKAELLKYAGLREVSIGIQSGSEDVRRNVYNRAGKNNKIIEENAVLAKLNIMTYYDFIIKNPFESEKDYQMSLDLIHTLRRPFYLKFYTLSYYLEHPITKMALENRLIQPKEVSSTIGYLDVTTPHKVVLLKHYHLENRLVIWHRKLINDTRGWCSIEPLYYLLMSWHGFWFMPKFVLNFLRLQFIKKRFWILYIFAILIQNILLIRNNLFVKKVSSIVSFCREKGLLWVIGKIYKKIYRICIRACR